MFNDLLASFLHIRNELTELDSREKEAKMAAADSERATTKGEEGGKREGGGIIAFGHLPSAPLVPNSGPYSPIWEKNTSIKQANLLKKFRH